jgi:hypothetical protein
VRLPRVEARDGRRTRALARRTLSSSLAICLLFLSSMRFIESISASKYPRGYATYHARVSMFVPVLAPMWARNVLAVRVAPIELKRVARLGAVAHALIEFLKDRPVRRLEDGGWASGGDSRPCPHRRWRPRSLVHAEPPSMVGEGGVMREGRIVGARLCGKHRVVGVGRGLAAASALVASFIGWSG